MRPAIPLEAPAPKQNIISERTGVTLGVMWSILVALAGGISLAVSIKLDMIDMKFQAAEDHAAIRLIARKVGVDLPEDGK